MAPVGTVVSTVSSECWSSHRIATRPYGDSWAALAQVMKDRTTIVIAHRLSTVINADKIVVLEFGHVVEEGSHRILLARADGVYARYYRRQGESGLGLVDDLGETAPAVAEPRVRSAP